MRSEPPSRHVGEDFCPIPDVDRLKMFTFDDESKLSLDAEPNNHGTRTSGSDETESLFFLSLSLGYIKGSGTFHGWTFFFLRVEGWQFRKIFSVFFPIKY